MTKFYFIALSTCLLCYTSAHAGKINITEENDGLVTVNDRDYTQGIRFAYTTDALDTNSGWQSTYDWTNRYSPFFDGGTRQVSYMFGQNMFTPVNKRISNPDPNDRPYAGWLYGGVSLMEDHQGKSLDNVELLVGVVGPASLAEQTQSVFHDWANHYRARGWGHQIRNEPGVALSMERKWRFHAMLLEDAALGVEAIPELGATLGNVWTYGQTGVMFRLGSNLKADYGVVRIRPNLSGSDYFNPQAMDGWFGWNIFAGVQGRAVARNIFLDGNTFGASREVDKKNFVGNAVVGASFYGSSGPRLDAAMIFCKQEFETTRGCSKYGGVNLGWAF